MRKPSPTRKLRPVLLTGFDAFGGELVNPSWLAVRKLHGESCAGRRIVAVRLPTAFEGALTGLRRALARHRPQLVLCVGQAGGRAGISLERVALNLIDARMPDNSGAQPIDAPVIAGAPEAYFARLPLRAMLAAMRAAGIPAELSLSAGSFVCNAVFYALMHAIAQDAPRTSGGFIHVPFAPAQVAQRPQLPSMAIEDQVAALRIAVRAALRPGRRPATPDTGREH